MDEYKGKIRLVYKSYSQNEHDWAVQAATAAFCVAKQRPEAFFAMKDYFQDKQKLITAGTVYEVAEAQAKKLVPGLDQKKYKECIDKKTTLQLISINQTEAASVGVRLMPTFFVNGYVVVGAGKYDELKAAVDRAIEEAGKKHDSGKS